jgi:hypothetical protein
VIYRKWGRVVRWENGTLVRVEEAGEAREEKGIFLAQPIAERVALPEVDVSRVVETARAIGEAERVIVTEGVAIHECDGVRWQEETRRVHVALTRRPWRVLVDDVDVAPVASALARCEGERDFEHVLLAPNVARHLMEDRHSCLSVWHAGTGKSACPPLSFEQMPGGLDGYGRPIERRRVEGEPPNFFRPSYRLRPVRRWMNVRAIPFGDMNVSAPRAIALVDAAVPAALVDDHGRTFITRLRVDRVTAAAGSGEMLL